MSAIIGSGVTHKGIVNVEGNVTCYLDAGVTKADVGKPVALVAATNYTVAVATTGNRIFGRLLSFEERVAEGINVGTVETCGFFEFPVLDADALAVGNSVVGGAGGTVKAGSDSRNFVTAVAGAHPNKKAIVKLS